MSFLPRKLWSSFNFVIVNVFEVLNPNLRFSNDIKKVCDTAKESKIKVKTVLYLVILSRPIIQKPSSDWGKQPY